MGASKSIWKNLETDECTWKPPISKRSIYCHVYCRVYCRLLLRSLSYHWRFWCYYVHPLLLILSSSQQMNLGRTPVESKWWKDSTRPTLCGNEVMQLSIWITKKAKSWWLCFEMRTNCTENTFSILHSAFCKLHSAFCILHTWVVQGRVIWLRVLFCLLECPKNPFCWRNEVLPSGTRAQTKKKEQLGLVKNKAREGEMHGGVKELGKS